MSEMSQSEKDIAENIFNIMTKSTNETPPSQEDMNYLINNATPMVEILKRSMTARLTSLGVNEEEARAMLSVLSEMSTIAGGINFSDFSTTEKLFSNIKEN
jgi:hypothetical protein